MTETAVVAIVAALIAAIPPTLVAWLALRQSRDNAKKAQEITTKVNEVHSLANSHLTAQTTALALANEKISGLEKMLGSMAPKPKIRSKRRSAS